MGSGWVIYDNMYVSPAQNHLIFICENYLLKPTSTSPYAKLPKTTLLLVILAILPVLILIARLSKVAVSLLSKTTTEIQTYNTISLPKQAPPCSTLCAGATPPAVGICSAIVSWWLGYSVMWPSVLTAAVSAAMMRPFLPPLT